MDQMLQWIAGGGYLLNKICLAQSERARGDGKEEKVRRWRIISWITYLIGLPAWVIIFIGRRDWLAASLEAGGAPVMIFGLVVALRGRANAPPRWLELVVLFCIPFGLGYSIYDFGGITTMSQYLEVGLALGFLIGTYLLAKEKANGYLWYMPMHIACGGLMWIQNYRWLCLQQVVSLLFIVSAYRTARENESTGGAAPVKNP